MSNRLLMADISDNNPEFDAQAYYDAGHRAIMIKATEGEYYVNPLHRGWVLRAAARHLSVWHYHFARPDLGNTPEAEAAWFLRWALPLAGPLDYLVLDMERGWHGNFATDPQWSQVFDGIVQDGSRFHTILYASQSTLLDSDHWLTGDRRRVIDADWSQDPDYAPPGYTIAARQFTDGVFGPEPHACAGIGTCDISRVNPIMLRRV